MDNDDDLFASDFKQEPYWWTAAPRPEELPEPLPAEADVAVIGSGFTGLSAALTLARGGRDVVVLEAGPPGFGASSRNAGFVGKTLKHSFTSLLDSQGERRAVAIYKDLQNAFDCVTGLIEREQIACHFQQCGRYMAANTPAHYEAMARELENRRKYLGDESEMVLRQDQRQAFGSDRCHGGAIVPGLGALHPGLYHLGLLERARNAEVRVLGHTAVTALRRESAGFSVHTRGGTLRAREVVVATNGYTGRATPALRRRVVPFRGFMIATEELPEARLATLLPLGRTTQDYNNNLVYLRRAPDSPRILMGGLTGTMTDDLETMAGRLRTQLVALLPDLEGVRLSRAWNGFGAGTFDLQPHLGTHDGLHYAMGYCFAGVPMGTYLGHKLALRILGAPDAETVFADRPFPSKWWYHGTPWFLPAYIAHLDRLDRKEGL